MSDKPTLSIDNTLSVLEDVNVIAHFTQNEAKNIKCFLGAARMCGYELVKIKDAQDGDEQ